jgi:hypothetical protein
MISLIITDHSKAHVVYELPTLRQYQISAQVEVKAIISY